MMLLVFITTNDETMMKKKYEKFSTPLSYRVVVVVKCRAYFLLIENFFHDIFAPTMIRIILILHSNQQSNEKILLTLFCKLNCRSSGLWLIDFLFTSKSEVYGRESCENIHNQRWGILTSWAKSGAESGGIILTVIIKVEGSKIRRQRLDLHEEGFQQNPICREFINSIKWISSRENQLTPHPTSH